MKQTNIKTVDEMADFCKRLRLKSFNDENYLLTVAPLIKHFHGELKHEDRVYFLVDGEWYEIENDFLQNIDNELMNIVDENINKTILCEPWELNVDESNYNQKYLGKPGFLVLDKVTLKNIEICDILNNDGKITYLIHVKKGFNNTIRELTSQIDVASRMLREARLSSDRNFFEQLYHSIKEKKNTENVYFRKVGEQTDTIPKDHFINMLMAHDLIFCLAFQDVAKEERSIFESYKFQSNIAKYSIVELHKKLKMYNIPLKIIQINRQ